MLYIITFICFGLRVLAFVFFFFQYLINNFYISNLFILLLNVGHGYCLWNFSTYICWLDTQDVIAFNIPNIITNTIITFVMLFLLIVSLEFFISFFLVFVCCSIIVQIYNVFITIPNFFLLFFVFFYSP